MVTVPLKRVNGTQDAMVTPLNVAQVTVDTILSVSLGFESQRE
jgi:hypothetical protein